MRLTALDLAIVATYLAGITLFGIAFRKTQGTVRDYFLGDRTAPWWALAISIVATETSTLTIIGTPAQAFAGNLTFLQLVLGYLVGRVVIVLVFLPHYFRGEYYTAYQLMQSRFGAKVKAVAASTFLVTRALAEGVRIAAIGLLVKAVLGTAAYFSSADRGAGAGLHLRRRNESRDLDRRGAMRSLSFGLARRFLCAAPQDSRGVEHRGARRRCHEQVSHLRFFLQPDQSRENVHVLVRRHWRRISDHGQPRHRPDHCATPAGRKI